MDATPGAASFNTSGAAYDGWMGRYSRGLAGPFADLAGVRAGQRVLDVGCGPGALTEELVGRLGIDGVAACDPSPPFVTDCAARFPGLEVVAGRAEALPFGDDGFDAAMAQLVLHFVSEPEQAVAEMARVVRPGGTVAANVWDFAGDMDMLRFFWDAALVVDPDAPDEARTLRLGGAGETSALFTAGGLLEAMETTLEVSTSYADLDELWSGFLLGIGPAGAYCVSLDPDRQAAIRAGLSARLGDPTGGFTLRAVARAATARVPG